MVRTGLIPSVHGVRLTHEDRQWCNLPLPQSSARAPARNKSGRGCTAASRRSSRFGLCVAAVGAALSSTAAAQTPPGWTVGGAVDGYYSYKEQTTSDPQFVSQFGPFAGVDLGYTWKVDSWSFRAEGNLALGYLDYRSSQTGTLQGLYNVEGEARTLAGDDLPVTGTLYVSPFAGLGY